ncbi:glycoside hydrolase family 43 protein [Pedobacter foliorum]|uniref:glycoside hydrolase family 43 protein n=1 Tax=Pedobacter foliorum TaxID=2739058 RepID=UPI001565A712|nr:glycoside hydrolase family 43 protein [Pedobacter foliorum]NRF37772.1 glycoside hydrolase family 43 protein [Pedobacter foliorum]
MQKTHTLLSCLIVLLFLFSNTSAQVTLKNPILPGFYPDPAICRVGTDYYMVTSTFVYFPGIPVFHSKDLKNWKQITSAIDRPSQMDFMGEQISRGLFAPAINYYKGTFYITCTNIDKGGNFIITAKNPAGPWSDPIYLKEVKGIDPSLYFEDDKVFIIYNSDPPDYKSLYSGHRTVKIYELDLATLKPIGTEKMLVNGGVDISKKPVWIEAPHIYKRNGYYYLMAAEGGTSVNHSEVIFRSKDVRGPFIPYEKNPILTQRQLDPKRKNPISSVGHADLVDGPDGNTYAVFLGVRPYEGDFYNTGREVFIAPVKWINDWPVINPDHVEVQYEYKVNWKEVKPDNQLPITGNFDFKAPFKDSLSTAFLFLRTHNPSWYNFKDNKDALTIKLLPQTILEKGNPAFIGRRQQHLLSSASTEMSFSTTKANEKAGMVIFQNENHFYFMCKSYDKGKDVIQLFKGNPATDKMDLLKQVELPSTQKNLYFKISSEGDAYSFWYALQENNWKPLADKIDGKYLSTLVAKGFVGALYGMYATSEGQSTDNKAVYKWFGYSGNDSTYEK